VTNADALDAEVAKVDLVISLIPYTHHVAVIRSAIRNKKNVVTTSYVSPAMQALDAEARAAGITVLNEIGLDPGIDHLYAIKTIDEVHRAGGRIRAFRSYCGGLPDPDVAKDNPLGYKFSWSPRGVLLALRNPARFWRDGAVVEIPGPQLMDSARPYPTPTGYDFVGYPNRDSTPYRERYGIPEAQTVERGTLRYRGFPEFVRVLVDLGFLSEEPKPFLDAAAPPLSWRETLQKLLDAPSSEEKYVFLLQAYAFCTV
jgi:saccharopine dehydrogenase (NADP+, L-glutamate forming)